MAKLNYHHLYYFWHVAKTGNLTETAKNLHVSQSALSSQIKQLETNMDVDLFAREGRKLVLTESGKRTLLYAEEIFAKGEELELLLKTHEINDIDLCQYDKKLKVKGIILLEEINRRLPRKRKFDKGIEFLLLTKWTVNHFQILEMKKSVKRYADRL